MYVNKSYINLATNASPVNNNLALLHGNDTEILASSLAVMQDGYVNIVPILNTSRRSKYIPICEDDRGAGIVKQVKWVELSKKTFLVILSTNGLQVYDAEGSNLLFKHGCRDTGDPAYKIPAYAVGICVLKNNVLCVGTWLGTVWMFRYELETNDFKFVNRVYAHDEAVLILDAKHNHMASTSTDMSYLWTFRGKDFDIIRKFAVRGVLSIPTTLKFSFGFIFIGYRSGEFCIFDINNEELEVRVPAHKLQVTGLDVSAILTIITGSDDGYVKLWSYNQEAEQVTVLQTILNEDGPVYGVGFLNRAATEFALVTGGSTKVNIYINWEESVKNMTTAV